MSRDVDIPNIDITEFLQGASSTWGSLEAAPCQLQVMLGAEYTELKAVHRSSLKLRERDPGVLQRNRVFGSGCFQQAQGRSCCSKCSFPSAPGSCVCQTVGQVARGSTRRDARGVWSRCGMRSSYCPREGAVDVFLYDTPVGHPTPALQTTSDGTW